MADRLAAVIQQLSRRNPRLIGMASAAAGADTLFGEQILRRRYPLSIVLPCPMNQFRQDFINPSDWARAAAIIRTATTVDVVSPIADIHLAAVAPPTTHGTPDQDPGQDPQYMEAGILTADRSDVFVAVSDEQPARGFGGTADIVAYARTIELPLFLINPVTGEITEERLDKLPAIDPTDSSVDNPHELVHRHFKTLNGQAGKCAPAVRQLVRAAVWLHLVAASCAAAAPVFQISARWLLFVAAFDVVVLTAAVTILSARERQHRQWLQLRAEAEVCRSFLAMWDIRRHVKREGCSPSVLPGMSALFGSLQMLGDLDQAPSKTLEEVRNTYAKRRVMTQLDYFERERRHAERQYKRRRFLMIGCTAGALFSSMLLALALLAGWRGQATHWLEFFAITLPLVATACGVLLVTDESSRRYVSYGEMTEVLNKLLLRVNGSRTWGSLSRSAEQVEDVLLQELLEWRAFVRHTEHLH